MCAALQTRPCIEPAHGNLSMFMPRYKSRLYAALGLNLWIVKMCQPLTAIEAQAASYATGLLDVACDITTCPCMSCAHALLACIRTMWGKLFRCKASIIFLFIVQPAWADMDF